MPNGDQHDNRPLWKRVKDMQGSKAQLEKENRRLYKHIKELEGIIKALKKTITVVEE